MVNPMLSASCVLPPSIACWRTQCIRVSVAHFGLRRHEPRVLGTVTFGAGSAICGVSLLQNGLLCAAGRHASGNVQVGLPTTPPGVLQLLLCCLAALALPAERVGCAYLAAFTLLLCRFARGG